VSDTISQHSRPQTTPLIVNSISNFQKSDITRKYIYRPIDFTYLIGGFTLSGLKSYCHYCLISSGGVLRLPIFIQE